MIIGQFLLWARNATPAQRARTVGSLAWAYLNCRLSPADRRDAETALTAMLDDPSPLVRLAMAEAFADAADAPRHVVVALASDHSAIAALVLSRSPLLSEADLIDCAALGDETVQTAIARRPQVPVPVSAALAEIGAVGALVALAGNPGAEIADANLWRMVERHGSTPALREVLLRRPNLPLDIRHAVAVAVSEALPSGIGNGRWRGSRTLRAFGEARDKATLALTATAAPDEVQRLVAHLRRSGQLTPALLLRALLSGSLAFVEAALAELTGLPLRRAAGLLHDRSGPGFGALYDRAGLPKSLRPAFTAAIAALHETDGPDTPLAGAQLSQRMIERVLTACADLPAEEVGNLTALLRRYEVEAARASARSAAGALADDAALAVMLECEPLMLIEADRVGRRRAA